MFLKVTQSIGILSLFTLLGTSISHAETPVDITNKEGNVAVSSNYERWCNAYDTTRPNII